MGKKEQFPYVGTTYRLTEHFHTWTKHALLNAIAQPEQFVEISETLAAAKGINNGERVTVSSKRGFIRAVAVVTRRLKPLNVNGQQVETVGIPIHWGFEGVARKGYIANTLTPNVGDANSQRRNISVLSQHREGVRGRTDGYGNAGHYQKVRN